MFWESTSGAKSSPLSWRTFVVIKLRIYLHKVLLLVMSPRLQCCIAAYYLPYAGLAMQTLRYAYLAM